MPTNHYHERRARRSRAWRTLAAAATILAVLNLVVVLVGPSARRYRLVVLPEAHEAGKAVLLSRDDATERLMEAQRDTLTELAPCWVPGR